MFGILNETILAIYVLFTKVAKRLPTLIRSRKTSPWTEESSSPAHGQTQLTGQQEWVRQILSYLGIELRSKVPVPVRTDRRYFRRR